MANIEELAKEIRILHKGDPNDFSKKADLCFELMTLYCRINKKRRTKEDLENCCYVAVILSGIINRNLANRTRKFLEDFDIPKEAKIIISANIIRMAGH